MDEKEYIGDGMYANGMERTMLPKLADDFLAPGTPVKVTRHNGTVAFGVVEYIHYNGDGKKIVQLAGRSEMFNASVDKVEVSE